MSTPTQLYPGNPHLVAFRDNNDLFVTMRLNGQTVKFGPVRTGSHNEKVISRSLVNTQMSQVLDDMNRSSFLLLAALDDLDILQLEISQHGNRVRTTAVISSAELIIQRPEKEPSAGMLPLLVESVQTLVERTPELKHRVRQVMLEGAELRSEPVKMRMLEEGDVVLTLDTSASPNVQRTVPAQLTKVEPVVFAGKPMLQLTMVLAISTTYAREHTYTYEMDQLMALAYRKNQLTPQLMESLGFFTPAV